VIGSSVWGDETRIWVCDRSPGIPLDQQDRIFERFTQVEGHRRSEGAGLGLAIVKAMVEAHHGRVQVRSRPGAGSTFTIVLPVDQPIMDEGDRS
jgi:two-component system OmpR family sensor kinase